MKEVDIWRLARHDQGTEGILVTQGFSCKTFELPWRNNQRSISCIPPDTYEVVIRQSPKYGLIYWIKNVPNRSWVLIHAGNFAGDVEKGWKTHVRGCILLGKEFGYLGKQRAVLNSRIAVRGFMSHMNYESFTLNIREAFRNG